MLAAALLAALSHWMLALVVFPCLLVAVRPVVLFRSTVVLAVPPQAVLLPWPLAMSAALTTVALSPSRLVLPKRGRAALFRCLAVLLVAVPQALWTLLLVPVRQLVARSRFAREVLPRARAALCRSLPLASCWSKLVLGAPVLVALWNSRAAFRSLACPVAFRSAPLTANPLLVLCSLLLARLSLVTPAALPLSLARLRLALRVTSALPLASLVAHRPAPFRLLLGLPAPLAVLVVP